MVDSERTDARFSLFRSFVVAFLVIWGACGLGVVCLLVQSIVYGNVPIIVGCLGYFLVTYNAVYHFVVKLTLVWHHETDEYRVVPNYRWRSDWWQWFFVPATWLDRLMLRPREWAPRQRL